MLFMSNASNFAFEADAVRQRTVSCGIRGPRGSTRRYVSIIIIGSAIDDNPNGAI